MSTPILVNVNRREFLKAAFDGIRSAHRTDRCRFYWQNRSGEMVENGSRYQKRRLWLVPNQSENCFQPRLGVDPQAGRLASSIFWSFASHALQAYTVGADACSGVLVWPVRRRQSLLHAIATKQSTSEAYQRGVYGVLRADIMRRKNAVKMATLMGRKLLLDIALVENDRRRKTRDNRYVIGS